MRIWSLHPEYLDTKGLVALWRETLLAKHVLEGKTKGYKNHPQLYRFINCRYPLESINYYLSVIFNEAKNRNYNFDKTKFDLIDIEIKLKVNRGQLNYEFEHLLNKLIIRDNGLFEKYKNLKKIKPHPLFAVIDGEVEGWEIVTDSRFQLNVG